MRVLHVGNIANNAYSNVKFLRRKGVSAEVLCYDDTFSMDQPEWEDAEPDGRGDECSPTREIGEQGSFRRPAWFIQGELLSSPTGRKQWFRGQVRLGRLAQDPVVLVGALQRYWQGGFAGNGPRPKLTDFIWASPLRRRFEEWFAGYDLIQAYGLEPIYAWLFGRRRPYVAFEHGTMREIPFEDSRRGRLLAVAYQRANRVLITNPDVLTAAQRLGLKGFQFIPHPVDETKYRPEGTTLRQELENRYQTDCILFAPSRQNWALKGNDQVIRAFARLLKATKRRPILILGDWGQEMNDSRELIKDLGITESVVWVPPLPKMRLIDYYNAADMVLDQFTLGVFGSITPEAMACAKPVMLHFDRALHEWCYAEMPPVVSARTEGQIYEAMLRLIDDDGLRSSIGQSSREWVVKHHGWELVADRQISLYRELLQQ